jgi:hypothetical protein
LHAKEGIQQRELLLELAWEALNVAGKNTALTLVKNSTIIAENELALEQGSQVAEPLDFNPCDVGQWKTDLSTLAGEGTYGGDPTSRGAGLAIRDLPARRAAADQVERQKRLIAREELDAGAQTGNGWRRVRDSPEAILRNADLALYRAKCDGRGAYRFFEQEMDTQVRARRALESQLRRPLPAQVRIALSDISGFEARDPLVASRPGHGCARYLHTVSSRNRIDRTDG